MRAWRILLCVVVVLSSGALAVAGEASSDDSYSVTVSPVRLELSADPGSSIEATVTVRNMSPGLVELGVETIDFVASDEPGTPEFVPADESPWSMSPWVRTTPGSLSLESSQQETVTVSIDVPEDAEPGGHYAAVFFASTPSAESGQTGVIAKVGTLLLLTVSGDIREQGTAALSAPWIIANGPLPLDVSFTNTGNVHVAPAGEVVVRTLRGTEVTAVDVGGENVLPDSSREFAAAWEDLPVFGIYRASATLTYGNSHTAATNTRTIIVAPWPYILAAIVIFLLGFVPGRLSRRRRE